MAADPTWNALPHDPLEAIEDNLWRVEGPLPGMGLRRVMTLARLDDGRIVIHSAVPLDDASMTRIEQWGRPGFLVVPSRYHRRDAPAYKRRYTDLCVLCPRAARPYVERVVSVDGDYDAFPSGQSVRLRHLEGTANREGVMIVEHRAGTTLVFNDLVFNMPHTRGLEGWVLRHVTRSSGGPRFTRISRAFVIKDRSRLKAELLQFAETPKLRRIIVAHHRVIDEEPASVLRKLAEQL